MESISSNLERLVKKEIERVEKILQSIICVDLKCRDVLININSYFNDAKYFFSKNDLINAFEAIIICWAYLDCLIKIGMIKKDI
ncbi:MAG: DUF357 domain-containing protein [Candidatus Aenigmarchaeota archaeon]|nr:DUF357 domain-containing protein [Candidatus Aenigmarchaeota archaeon]MDW8149147.1 DUF357 domain-containing protein [Candidatus Aenigmarchaeota archaeon]